MNNNVSCKLFGVALDASDDPFSMQLKNVAMNAQEQGFEGMVMDPYDALFGELTGREGIEPAGKFSVPSWLGAIPKPSDRDLVTRETMERFVDGGGVVNMVRALKDFVSREILPAVPVMVGIDHATTAGVVSALSERLGSDSLTVVALDRHFDALPLSVRMSAFADDGSDGPGELTKGLSDDACCCGDFWASLIADGIVDPRHLVMVGVADYPALQTEPKWGQAKERYLAYERQGCRFFPLQAFADRYEEDLRDFLVDAATPPFLYVSLDLDVGAYRAVHTARYMDGPGIAMEDLLGVADIIHREGRSQAFTVVGLDVMEFNMHFLGLETGAGGPDRTLEAAAAFVRTLIGGRGPDSDSPRTFCKG